MIKNLSDFPFFIVFFFERKMSYPTRSISDQLKVKEEKEGLISRFSYFQWNGKLLKPECLGYRAAGILPYQWHKETNKLFVLLTAEVRSHHQVQLNICGGKRE